MENYISKDVNAAAFLVVAGYRLLGTQWDGSHLNYVFPPEASTAVAVYRISSDGEYARKLLQAYRTLRGLFLDAKDAHRGDAA